MWGKLAQGLGEHAGDLRSGLAKLSDVVAPAVDEDEYEEYEEYEEEDYEDGDDYEDEEYERVKEMTGNLKKGFASLISRIAPTDDGDDREEEFVQVKDHTKHIDMSQQSSLVEDEEKLGRVNHSFEQKKLIVPKLTISKTKVEKKKPFHSGSLVSRSQQSEPSKKNSSLDVSLVGRSNQIRTSSSLPTQSFDSMEVTKETVSSSISKDSSNSLNKINTVKRNDVTIGKHSGGSSSNEAMIQKLKEKDNEIEQLQQKCREVQPRIDPVIVKEKDIRIQTLEQKYNALQSRVTVDNNAGREKDTLIHELERKCQELQSEQSKLTSIVDDKESQTLALEQNCSELQSKVRSDTILAKERDNQIKDLEQKYRELKSVPTTDPILVENKNNQIKNLQEECHQLQSQTVADPAVVIEKSNQIQKLKEKCRDLEEKSSSDGIVVEEKDTQIKALQQKCSELQSAATRRHNIVEKKDTQINQLQQRLHELKTQSTALDNKAHKFLELEEKCRKSSDELEKVKEEAAIAEEKSELIKSGLKEKKEVVKNLEKKYTDLEGQLRQREDHILKIQKDSAQCMEEEENLRESQLLKFKQEQAAMIEANSESVSSEYRQQIEEVKTELLQQKQKLLDQLGEEKMNAIQKQRQLEHLLEESNARMAKMEADGESTLSKQKLAETESVLDDRNEELKSLKDMVKELKSKMRETMENQGEYEEEVVHLRDENETLHHNWQVTEDENEELKKQLDLFSSKDDVINSLKKEIQQLKNSKDREQASIASKVEDAESNNATLQADRDAAFANVRDLEHQLAAALADAEVAKCDTERIMKGNSNLNRALESFQSERDTEIRLLQEEHKSSIEMTEAAHAVSMQATIQMNENKMKDVQYAADTEIKKMMAQFDQMKSELEDVKKVKLQTRRLLDEAISRLQASQEDVVDRSMMKNVLLDWFARSGKSRGQVLEVMASLLHFSEDEKERVHLYGGSRGISKVVESVASLPPAATDVQNLEGDNVRDKWVNFLLAEAENS